MLVIYLSMSMKRFLIYGMIVASTCAITVSDNLFSKETSDLALPVEFLLSMI